MERESRVDPLCCCEYFNNKNERSHVLLCCCNCVEFDLVFDRLICCNPVPTSVMGNLFNSIQDRLRIPWLHGAIRIPFEAILPALILVISALISAINSYCLVFIIFALPLLVQYTFKCFVKFNTRTRFLLFFIIYSCAGLFFIYQSIVIEFCEINVMENFIFITSSASAILCFHKVRQKAETMSVNRISIKSEKIIENTPSNGHMNSSEEPLLELNGNCTVEVNEAAYIPDSCICGISKQTEHCRICQTCVMGRKFHSLWLNCCISKHNIILYNMGMIFASISLLYGSNLILTTVCHPFEFMFGVLLPDDCEDVFYDTTLKTCFLAGVYSLELGIGVLILLIYQVCC